eukprot:TRINITY_DN9792_c0_g1_i2.p1 TRINITY_DN9792_c0_g1~~TRINITY_DN9792_c0_g1_i2.p1  ORF type:complete len:157 (+),score=36.03 TRINITY_DN9792_c0_g1_i2:1231-1701(+)
MPFQDGNNFTRIRFSPIWINPDFLSLQQSEESTKKFELPPGFHQLQIGPDDPFELEDKFKNATREIQDSLNKLGCQKDFNSNNSKKMAADLRILMEMGYATSHGFLAAEHEKKSFGRTLTTLSSDSAVDPIDEFWKKPVCFLTADHIIESFVAQSE